jgi:rRNA processing protein Krr1/Pno1
MSNNLIIVPISNEPVYGFKRTATMAALLINALPFMGENVNLTVQVDYFEPITDAPITIIAPKIVNLIAVGAEFDYYMSLLEQPVIIQDLVIAKIEEADSEGRFN